jgi:hypothetical protein
VAAPLSAVWAGSCENWFAAGKGVLVNAGVVERRPGLDILGLEWPNQFGVGLLALGRDQLILQFDGKKWVQEHYLPKRPQGRRDEDALHRLSTLVGIAAYGPSLVLVRERTNSTWTAPPERDRERLLNIFQPGPETRPLPGCTVAHSTTFDAFRDWFTCQDGRSFLSTRPPEGVGGQMTATGEAPRVCRDGLLDLRARGEELYALCKNGTLWNPASPRWRRVPAPPDLRSISVTQDCIFAASTRAVWRSCLLQLSPQSHCPERKPVPRTSLPAEAGSGGAGSQ